MVVAVEEEEEIQEEGARATQREESKNLQGTKSHLIRKKIH